MISKNYFNSSIADEIVSYISYKKAWDLIDSANKSAKEPLIITNTGGKGGGGAQLTEHGKSLISAFETINKNCWEFLDQQLETIKSL